jgi:hypothetical protein
VTKFARLNLRVPIDDALPVGQLRDHLRDALEERGIETLDLKAEPPNGETDTMLPNAPRKGRIYWPAAEVVMATERAPPPAPQNKAGKRAARAA